MSASSTAEATDGVPRPAAIVLTVLIPFGCGFYISYLIRTVNAVIAPQLVSEIGLTPSELGFLTGVFFITFAALQLPLGVLLDRYGPRRVQAGLLVLAALGSFLFAIGDGFVVLCLARGLIGLGVAGCLMAAFKANAIWWPTDRLPLMNNFIAAFGSFGALSATVPVQWFLEIAGWREMFVAMGVLILAIAAATWWVVPERPGSLDRSAGMGAQFRAFGTISRDPFFWRVACLLMVCQGGFLAYQTLWAGPWLRDVAGFGEAETGLRLMFIQAAMFAGVLLFGFAADLLRRTRLRPRTLVAMGIGVFLVAEVALAAGATGAAGALWALFGFAGPVTFLCFSIFNERFPEIQVGRVITAANLLIFAFAFAAQWGIGVVIDLFPQADLATGHSTAFAIVIAIQFAAYLLFVWPSKVRRSEGREAAQ